MIDWPTVDVIRGDMRTVLAEGEPERFHSMVTDPPYGLGFMGKGWDHGVPGVEYWRHAFRALKPGAHLAAFSSPRTYHRLAVAIEDAGFELRDCLMWLYGTGFPKGLDVAKAIDKQRHDRPEVLEVCAWVRERRDAAGLTNTEIDDAFGFVGMAGHWTSKTSQPAVPTLEQVPTLFALLQCDPLLDVPPRIRELLIELNGKKGEFGAAWHAREVTGTVEEWDNRQNYALTSRDGLRRDHAHSVEAQAWEGWSTALKPAWEPIVLARKPLPSGWTVAQSVLANGTGAINIGAAAIDFADEKDKAAAAAKNRHADFDSDARGQTRAFGADNRKRGNYDADARVPANLILDPTTAALLDLEAGEPVSRFFYCAKASSDERDAGLENLPEREKESRYGDTFERGRNTTTGERTELMDRFAKNFHPTVKPLALMRWVCRLITPPGGRIVDPFSGSGSTLCAAALEGFGADGIDLDTDEQTGEPIGYTDIAQARANYWRGEAMRLAEGGARPPVEPDRVQVDMFG